MSTCTEVDGRSGRDRPVSDVVPRNGNERVGGQVDGHQVCQLVTSTVHRLYEPAPNLLYTTINGLCNPIACEFSQR